VYFDLQLLNEKEGLLREMHAVRVRIAEAHQARADHGLEPVSATQLAQIQMLELDKQLAAAASQRHILRESLRFLIGADATGLRELAPVELQERQPALPSSLGFELLAHRPDLQALRWYVQSSMDQISAAKAAFYPSFDIRAFAGFDSLHTNELLHRSSRQLNLIPGMSLPLFDSGRLNAGLAATRSQSNALIAQYNEAVLQAVREVAQRSIDLDGLRQRSDLQTQKVHAAEFVARSAEACHQRGLIDSAISGESSLPWLAERTFALELHGACLHAEVALIATLGGGYEVMPKRQKIAVAKPENSAR
jgi:multidrug efflux system outer membrane protein